jgi:hypothetical protein
MTSNHRPQLRRNLSPLLCGAVVASLVTGIGSAASAQTTTCMKEPCPRPDATTLQSTYGTSQLRQTSSMVSAHFNGLSGGPADAPITQSQNGYPCRGFVGTYPDHILQLDATTAVLNLNVTADGDTTLVVHGPDGWFCIDDTNDYNPALSLQVRGGIYRVWVGSYSIGNYHNYSLDVSTYLAADMATQQPSTNVPPHQPYPHQPPPIYQPPPQLVVQGRLEDLDVRFDGATIDEVHSACMRFVAAASGIDFVDDIVVNGHAARNGPGYWEAEAICGIVTLNARPEGASASDAFVVGTLEDVPFEVHGTSAQARDILTRFLPLAVDMTWADDVVVNGQARRNQSGYWSLAEVVMQITSLGR